MASVPRKDSVDVVRRCHRCAGEGLIDLAHCRACGHGMATDAPWWDSKDVILPCDHEAATHLSFTARCPVCEGEGQVVGTLSKATYRSRQRRRLVRGTVLLLLGAIPFALLLLAIVTAEPATVCGSWWYGLVLLSAGAYLL